MKDAQDLAKGALMVDAYAMGVEDQRAAETRGMSEGYDGGIDAYSYVRDLAKGGAQASAVTFALAVAGSARWVLRDRLRLAVYVVCSPWVTGRDER